jgi:hypothetical protein
MKNNLLTALIISIVILGLLCVLWSKDKDRNIPQDSGETTTTIETTFELESTYQGDNLWKYRVTGDLPNLCYKANTNPVVMESYPEQIIIKVEVIQPEKDAICAQAIYQYEYEGIFNASEKAQISLETK